MKPQLFILGIALIAAPAIFAGPMTFNFTFSNVDVGATATGQFTIDSNTFATIVADPSEAAYLISDLQSLSITVSGSGLGDGTYGLSDYSYFLWWSAGASFDYSKDLVGQATSIGSWGTPDGSNGDFSFCSAFVSAAPDCLNHFTIVTNAGNDYVLGLTSLTDPAVPEPGTIGLVAVGGLAVLAKSRRRVR